MKLRFLNGPYQSRVVDLKADGLTIGRGPENDLTIEDDGISRRHALISCQGDQCFIEDMGSTNGVRLNGRRITFREPVKRGDHVGVGPFVLQITDTGDIIETDAILGRTGDKAPAAAPQLVPSGPPKAPFPWGQTIILLVLVGAFGVLAYKTFFADGGKPGTAAPPATHQEAAVTPPVTPAPAPESTATVKPVESRSTAETAPAEGTPSEEPAKKPAAEANAAPGDQAAPPILIASEPAGATVKVDEAVLGTTPFTIRALPPGRHTITLNLRGYEELVRQIHYPALIPDKPYALRQKAGTLLITSTPPGATVQMGPRVVGQTPLLLDDLPPGDHEFRLLSVCNDPVVLRAKISDIKPEVVTATLQPRLGGLEIITFPAGCDILIDGALVGRTVAASAETRESKPLAVTGLIEGEHEVVIQHPLEILDRFRVSVTRGEPKRYQRRLWVLDTEVVLIDGTKHYGMIIETNKFGDIILAETSKLEGQKRYLKPTIAKVSELTAEQSRALLKKLRTGGLRSEKPDGETEPVPPAEKGGPITVPAKPVSAVEQPAAEAEEPLLAEDETVSVASFTSAGLVLRQCELIPDADRSAAAAD